MVRQQAGVPAEVATTGVSEKRTVELPDGSRVVLSAASSLRTLGGYGRGAREVELSGEALFTVTHDEERPFRVRTPSGAVIEDLGTQFSVRALPRQALRVAVSEGSVRVTRSASATQAVVLNARDVVVLPDTGDPVVSRGVDVEDYGSWAAGRLVFRNTELSQALADIERWYDVEFDVTDSALLSRRVTVTFENEPIDVVLENIGAAVDTKFERQGRRVSVAAAARTSLHGPPSAVVGSGA